MVKQFAQLVREIREEYGISQRVLAKRLGTFKSAVTGWETDRRNPRRLYVDRLAQEFPEYRPRLYVSSRILPLRLGAETESKLCRALE